MENGILLLDKILFLLFATSTTGSDVNRPRIRTRCGRKYPQFTGIKVYFDPMCASPFQCESLCGVEASSSSLFNIVPLHSGWQPSSHHSFCLWENDKTHFVLFLTRRNLTSNRYNCALWLCRNATRWQCATSTAQWLPACSPASASSNLADAITSLLLCVGK